uniref:DUF5641 domain-containing protein n=1 Tax=Heligmosomoides polygyrus TaxID=6339 RepID=A0A8L8Q4E4_HELPZ
LKKAVLFSDSQIVLSWLKKMPDQNDLGRLVNNRIRELRRIIMEDSSGVWRARGRLGPTNLENSAKFPILISPKSKIADLIVQEAHGKFHNGVAHTMSVIRREYWIPKLRQKEKWFKKGALQTRKQAEEALHHSYGITQRIWKQWHDEYLLSLREQHRKWMSSSRINPVKPQVGAVVLLADPILSRNEWRLARIIEILPGEDGNVREAKLVTAKGRQEFDCEDNPLRADQSEEPKNDARTSNSSDNDYKRYHLRKRTPVSYRE